MSITIFSKPGCIQCTQTTKKFDAAGLEYQVKDISKSAEWEQEARSFEGFRSFPVVFAGEISWGGYNPDKIAEVISLFNK
jgi:glutaredoxin-like protein NrdH